MGVHPSDSREGCKRKSLSRKRVYACGRFGGAVTMGKRGEERSGGKRGEKRGSGKRGEERWMSN